MKSFSNTYIFIFSTVMVILVAAILSTAAMVLQPLQQKNMEIEQKKKILASIGIVSDADDAESLYEKYIKETYVVDINGNVKEGVDAFTVNIKDELRKAPEEKNLPVYIGTLKSGEKRYVFPMRGLGLWGPIFGYVSFEKDFNTILGTDFDHDGETPGLGAEITTDWFQEQFIGKKIFSPDGEFISIKMKKGRLDPNSLNEVQAISGSTLTTNGLEDMLRDCLGNYEAFFKQQMN